MTAVVHITTRLRYRATGSALDKSGLIAFWPKRCRVNRRDGYSVAFLTIWVFPLQQPGWLPNHQLVTASVGYTWECIIFHVTTSLWPVIENNLNPKILIEQEKSVAVRHIDEIAFPSRVKIFFLSKPTLTLNPATYCLLPSRHHFLESARRLFNDLF